MDLNLSFWNGLDLNFEITVILFKIKIQKNTAEITGFLL